MKKYAVLLTMMLLPLTGFTEVSNEAAIEQRQAAFKEIKEAMKAVKDGMKAEDAAATSAAAESVLTNATAVTKLFPAGSFEGDTRAKEKIWDNLDDFTERQEKLVSDAGALVAAAGGTDDKQLKAAFKQTSKNCKSCHFKYRQVF